MSAWLMTVVDALGMALLHSVWQLTLMALLLWSMLRMLESGSAVVRYWVSTLLLLAAPVVFVATAATHWDPAASEVAVLAVLAPAVAGPVVPAGMGAFSWQIADLLPAMVGLWGCGVVAFSVIFLSGLLQTRRLKTAGIEPVSMDIQAQVAALASALGIRGAVDVVRSTLVDVPMVVGALRPVILLPAVVLTGLNPEQLESILIHELAHVRRRDLWINLLQGVVEIVLFFHPAVWWISRRIRAERELCCDDVVAARIQPVVYARALLLLEEHRSHRVALAAAATDGSLRHRIERLVGPTPAPQRSSRSLSAVVLISLIGLLSTQQSIAADDDLTALMDDFLTMEITINDDSVSQEEQDDDLRGDLMALGDAFNAIEVRMNALLEADPDRWAMVVLVRSAQAREHLGSTIQHSDLPDYFSRRQAQTYHAGLDAKADRQYTLAQEAYEMALVRAEKNGRTDVLVDEARAGVLRMDQRRGSLGEPIETAIHINTAQELIEAGEAAMEEGDAQGAAELFAQVEMIAEGDTADYARYKQAWCQSSLGNHDEAIAIMEKVMSSESASLRAEGLVDLAKLYVRAERLEEGEARFEDLDAMITWRQVEQGL